MKPCFCYFGSTTTVPAALSMLTLNRSRKSRPRRPSLMPSFPVVGEDPQRSDARPAHVSSPWCNSLRACVHRADPSEISQFRMFSPTKNDPSDFCHGLLSGDVGILGAARVGTAVLVEELVRRLAEGEAGLSLFTFIRAAAVGLSNFQAGRAHIPSRGRETRRYCGRILQSPVWRRSNCRDHPVW